VLTGRTPDARTDAHTHGCMHSRKLVGAYARSPAYSWASRWADLLIARLAPSVRWAAGRTDTHTDRHAAAKVTVTSCKLGKQPKNITRGRVRAGPSLQLGTQSTGIANLLCIIHSALSRLSCRAYACRPCYARHTHSGLVALCIYCNERAPNHYSSDM